LSIKINSVEMLVPLLGHRFQLSALKVSCTDTMKEPPYCEKLVSDGEIPLESFRNSRDQRIVPMAAGFLIVYVADVYESGQSTGKNQTLTSQLQI
jgi:hypothetical protein